MGTTVPADIANLVKKGTPVCEPGPPPGPLLIVGKVSGSTCDVFVDGAAPDTHNLVDLVLDLDDKRSADRAVRWASTEYGVRLGRLRNRADLLSEQILRLAGEPGVPAVDIVPLPQMATEWALWFPGGPSAPSTYTLRTPAHRDSVTRWLGAQLGFPVGPTAPEWIWFDLNNERQGWQLIRENYWASFETGGLRRWDDASRRLDKRYAIDPRFAQEIDPARALAIGSLQTAIVINPGDPDVPEWIADRDTLIGEI